jgi:hypothetical protein
MLERLNVSRNSNCDDSPARAGGEFRLISDEDRSIGTASSKVRRPHHVAGLWRGTILTPSLGLLIALGGSRLIGSFLFGVGALDPITLILTAAAIIGVAGVASFTSATPACLRVTSVTLSRLQP